MSSHSEEVTNSPKHSEEEDNGPAYVAPPGEDSEVDTTLPFTGNNGGGPSSTHSSPAGSGRGVSLPRVDSLMNAAILLDGSTNHAEGDDDVTVDGDHKPPSDVGNFFSAPIQPAKGKYMDLIRLLLKMNVSAADRAGYCDKDLATELCEDVMDVLNEEPSLLNIDITAPPPAATPATPPAAGTAAPVAPTAISPLVVVGDIHGQFHDMVTHVLSQQYDRPTGTPDKRFLFMGDFVDRGPHGVEVLMLLFALKVEFPHMVYMLRGNHEDSQTSRIYGFFTEVRDKFDGDETMWCLFNTVFCSLPLAAKVIAPRRKFMCVHGGLSPLLGDLDEVGGINRHEYGGGSLDPTSESIVDGLLWSDPSDEMDDFEQNERGCGYIFGVDATKDFCRRSGLDFICRAHQLSMEGYCYTHDDKCLTVFSAPNYCGLHDNKGAIMVVDGESLSFKQFTSAGNGGAAQLPATMPWSRFFS